MKTKILYAGLLALSLAVVTSCHDEKKDLMKMSDMTVSYTAPANVTATEITNVKITMKNLSTGQSKEYKYESISAPVTIQVEEGLYNIELEGNIKYMLNGKEVTSVIRGSKESVKAVGAVSISLETYFHTVKEGFVFAEIFLSGTRTPEGKTYTGDSYFRIVNNSDETLYADGLCLFESDFQTDMKQNYTPDIMNQAMTVATGFMVPGDGTQYPVKPGESLLICDNAINHKNINPNSFDLSHADFEWWAESSNPDFTDSDNPEVPNLIPVMKESATLWQPHTRGVKAYALAYLNDGVNRITPEQFVTNYRYDYKWLFVFNDFQTEMEGSGYMLPNGWVVDAVNLSPATGPQWLVTDPSLDKGYASVSAIDFDENRFGKCVRRKVDAGTHKLVDTNDSSADFENRVEADPNHVF